MAEMAISDYLGGLLLLMGVYPLALIAVYMFFGEYERKKISRWLNVACFILAAFLFYQHMQTEVIYGKELLDAWYLNNPDGAE